LIGGGYFEKDEIPASMWNFINLAFFIIALAVLLAVYWRSGKKTRDLNRRLTDLEVEEDRVFDFLHGIGAAFSEGVRSSELHRLIVESAVRILDGRGGALYLANKSETALTPSFISAGCPPFVQVPPHILEQMGNNPAALESYLQLQPVENGQGFIGECWETGQVQLVSGTDFHVEGSNSAIIGPLIYRHKILGVLAVANGVGATTFSEADLKVFRAIAEQSAFALYNEAIYIEAGEKKLLDRDLEIARDIQRILLPSAPPVFPGYGFSAVSIAARHVSGDYFDYIPLGSDRLGVAIADVSGKGIPASLITAMCRGVLRREAMESAVASDVLCRVNRLLYPDIKEDMFISMAYLILESTSGRVMLARAGHDAPLLYRAATQQVEKLSPKGMALGIDSGEVFNRVCTDFSFEMETGDCILLYTDGSTEAMNHQGEEFSLERLVDALKAGAPHGAAHVVSHIADDVKTFVGAEIKHDDITLIAISKT
jgi:sigma-B regulation protein RsbU (phosphoserine phosphatase)